MTEMCPLTRIKMVGCAMEVWWRMAVRWYVPEPFAIVVGTVVVRERREWWWVVMMMVRWSSIEQSWTG